MKQEYEISTRALVLGAIVVLCVLSLGAAALISGLRQPHRVQARLEATQEAESIDRARTEQATWNALTAKHREKFR